MNGPASQLGFFDTQDLFRYISEPCGGNRVGQSKAFVLTGTALMKTRLLKKEDCPVETRRWYEIDASGKVLGRLATRAAVLLMGKDRVDYTPNVDCGAYVVVVNAEKVFLSGKKLTQKYYKRYTGYPGGLRLRTTAEMLAKHPDDVIRLAIRRMLPKTKLGREMLKKLKVYAGPTHPHTYAKPVKLNIET